MIVEGLTLEELPNYFDNILSKIEAKQHKPKPNNNNEITWFLTELIRCPIRTGLSKSGIEPPFPVDKKVFLQGNAIHLYMEQGYSKVEGMLSVQKDGIRARPDMFDDNLNCGVELKTTGYSSNTIKLTIDELSWKESFIQYLRQILGYMSMTNTTEWILLIIFTSGDYTNRSPIGKSYKVKASKELIEKNWKLILRNKQIAIDIVNNDKMVLPMVPIEHFQECSKCPYNSVCPSKAVFK